MSKSTRCEVLWQADGYRFSILHNHGTQTDRAKAEYALEVMAGTDLVGVDKWEQVGDKDSVRTWQVLRLLAIALGKPVKPEYQYAPAAPERGTEGGET